MIAEEELTGLPVEGLKRPLRETQQLPAAKAMSEDEIAELIAEHRVGR